MLIYKIYIKTFKKTTTYVCPNGGFIPNLQPTDKGSEPVLCMSVVTFKLKKNGRKTFLKVPYQFTSVAA